MEKKKIIIRKSLQEITTRYSIFPSKVSKIHKYCRHKRILYSAKENLTVFSQDNRPFLSVLKIKLTSITQKLKNVKNTYKHYIHKIKVYNIIYILGNA